MALVRRIASKPPTRAACRRLGVAAAVLAGGLAGLAIGAACVAREPEAGWGTGPRSPALASAGSSAGHRARPLEVDGVATVIAPAGEAGVAEPGRDAQGDAP